MLKGCIYALSMDLVPDGSIGQIELLVEAWANGLEVGDGDTKSSEVNGVAIGWSPIGRLVQECKIFKAFYQIRSSLID